MELKDLHVGRKIKELRKRKGFSLEELGKSCGCSKSYMSRIENGRRRIDVTRLQCIAKELGVNPDYFFTSVNINTLPRPSAKTSKTLRVPTPFPIKPSSDSAKKVYELTLRFEDAGEDAQAEIATIDDFTDVTDNRDFSTTVFTNRVSPNNHKKVLIVDDKPFVIEFIKDALDTYNIRAQVECAYSCTEAMEIFKKNLNGDNPVSLVLLDYIGIQGSGKDTLKEMISLNPDLPIIAMTGYGNREVRQNALDNGAFDFLEKPISLNELIKSVQRALKISDQPYPFAQASS